jgi:hypothetical protein
MNALEKNIAIARGEALAASTRSLAHLTAKFHKAPSSVSTRLFCRTQSSIVSRSEARIRETDVDPELVELADKTPYIDIHVLTRDEIAKLQIETTRH